MVMGVVRVLFWFVFWWFVFGFLFVFLVGWFLEANFFYFKHERECWKMADRVS